MNGLLLPATEAQYNSPGRPGEDIPHLSLDLSAIAPTIGCVIKPDNGPTVIHLMSFMYAIYRRVGTSHTNPNQAHHGLAQAQVEEIWRAIYTLVRLEIQLPQKELGLTGHLKAPN